MSEKPITEIDWRSGRVRDTRNRICVYYGQAVPTQVEVLPETWLERALHWFGRREYVEKMIRPHVEVRDSESIARIGERYMEVEGTVSWTEELARTMAEGALRDLSYTPFPNPRQTCPIINAELDREHLFVATQQRCLCGEKEAPEAVRAAFKDWGKKQ